MPLVARTFYFRLPTTVITTRLNEYVNKIECEAINIYFLEDLDMEAAQALCPLFSYPIAFTADLVELINQAIGKNELKLKSLSGYAWDLGWMFHSGAGIQISKNTIIFACQVKRGVKSFACTYIPSMGCAVFARLSEI